MRIQGIGENIGTGVRSAADMFLSGIGEDTMDSGHNPMVTKI